jgi:hypothetical protein
MRSPFSNTCGKCGHWSNTFSWQMDKVHFYKKLCPSCAIEVHHDVTVGAPLCGMHGYIVDSSYTCTPKPDFSKEKGNIKKGQIEEEIC